ncbi:Uncharacterised protein [Klebsiella pneumoniae subsp. ozaenae]|uniref:Uncharacterized protein n=1 Tax=Klebsiella pneumoniae subsp. ozaenae TaxID=574 RepID=A0A378C5B2_KLEPO|nr:Uncharacterised protein [Klebsiella pneumoniae subsp. ozaenae]
MILKPWNPNCPALFSVNLIKTGCTTLNIDFVPTVTAKSGLEVIRMAHLEKTIST